MKDLPAWTLAFAEDSVRRRVSAPKGLRNFFEIYRPLADHWRLYDNSPVMGPKLIASGNRGGGIRILDDETWRKIEGAMPK